MEDSFKLSVTNLNSSKHHLSRDTNLSNAPQTQPSLHPHQQSRVHTLHNHLPRPLNNKVNRSLNFNDCSTKKNPVQL